MRAETGPMKFGDDWRGVFIRGDNAAHYAYVLDNALYKLKEHAQAFPMDIAQLESLRAVLSSSNEHDKHSEEQIMLPFEDCITNDQ